MRWWLELPDKCIRVQGRCVEDGAVVLICDEVMWETLIAASGHEYLLLNPFGVCVYLGEIVIALGRKTWQKGLFSS